MQPAPHPHPPPKNFVDFSAWVLGVWETNTRARIMRCIIPGCRECHVNMGGRLIVCIDISANINSYFTDWLITIYVNEELQLFCLESINLKK